MLDIFKLEKLYYKWFLYFIKKKKKKNIKLPLLKIYIFWLKRI